MDTGKNETGEEWVCRFKLATWQRVGACQTVELNLTPTSSSYSSSCRPLLPVHRPWLLPLCQGQGRAECRLTATFLPRFRAAPKLFVSSANIGQNS